MLKSLSNLFLGMILELLFTQMLHLGMLRDIEPKPDTSQPLWTKTCLKISPASGHRLLGSLLSCHEL